MLKARKGRTKRHEIFCQIIKIYIWWWLWHWRCWRGEQIEGYNKGWKFSNSSWSLSKRIQNADGECGVAPVLKKGRHHVFQMCRLTDDTGGHRTAAGWEPKILLDWDPGPLIPPEAISTQTSVAQDVFFKICSAGYTLDIHLMWYDTTYDCQ